MFDKRQRSEPVVLQFEEIVGVVERIELRPEKLGSELHGKEHGTGGASERWAKATPLGCVEAQALFIAKSASKLP